MEKGQALAGAQVGAGNHCPVNMLRGRGHCDFSVMSLSLTGLPATQKKGFARVLLTELRDDAAHHPVCTNTNATCV